MAEPIFSVIIPVFNKWELTRDCLTSLKKQTKMSYEVIVIDNGSSDKTATHISLLGETLFGKNFTLIRNEENCNYGPASNAGARKARAPLLFFLNNDTIVTEGWEYPLVNELHNNDDIGAVGPLLLYEDDTIQHVGVSWNIFRSVEHMYRFFPRNHRVALRKRQVQTLTGAALMMPKSLFLNIGCFDERFRNGFEDVELSLRIGSSNKKLYCLPASVIYHLESQTPGRNRFEEENIFTLKESLRNFSVTVDKHTHALQDGFFPIINNRFDLAITLNHDEEKELTELYKNASLEIIYEVLKQNPYWRHGKSLLIDSFEKSKDYEKASQLAFSFAESFPSEESLKKAYDLCFLAKKNKQLVIIQKYMKEVIALKPPSDIYKKSLQYISYIGMKQNDSFLLEVVKQKRKQIDFKG